MRVHTDKAIEDEVVTIISRTKEIAEARLYCNPHLKDLGFDAVDVVDIILEVERNFHIVIPDEVPIDTVQDFVDYVATHTIRKAS